MASITQRLSATNEETWIRMGNLAETLQDYDKSLFSYENALRHNPYNVRTLTLIAGIYRSREQFPLAIDHYQRALSIDPKNGEIWGAMGHCYLMMEDLQKAYHAYQQSLYNLPNPRDPNLWYGIGILYERHGSIDNAEEAFTSVLKMDPAFEKANEIYFRLGITYKQQGKHDQSLECFRSILRNPPKPLQESDVWFQIGHVHELRKEYAMAKEAYENSLKTNPMHAKVLQQLGWLYHQSTTGFTNQEVAIMYLTRSTEADVTDGQSWYLLGRCYMAQQHYKKAYEAYQQAVYRDSKNPTFWCSIGVLYYQICQYRDALDAYSRAIRLNPYLSEVWYDLGTLYESCNQISDALDAYTRASDLDPNNKHIQQRLAMLRSAQQSGVSQPSTPAPAPGSAGTSMTTSAPAPPTSAPSPFSNLGGHQSKAPEKPMAPPVAPQLPPPSQPSMQQPNPMRTPEKMMMPQQPQMHQPTPGGEPPKHPTPHYPTDFMRQQQQQHQQQQSAVQQQSQQVPPSLTMPQQAQPGGGHAQAAPKAPTGVPTPQQMVQHPRAAMPPTFPPGIPMPGMPSGPRGPVMGMMNPMAFGNMRAGTMPGMPMPPQGPGMIFGQIPQTPQALHHFAAMSGLMPSAAHQLQMSMMSQQGMLQPKDDKAATQAAAPSDTSKMDVTEKRA